MRRERRGLAALEDLPQLQSLDLSDTPVTSTGMATVARMRGLHTLALSFGGAPQRSCNMVAHCGCDHHHSLYSLLTGIINHACHMRVPD